MHGLSPNPSPKREGLPPLSWERGIEGVRREWVRDFAVNGFQKGKKK